MNWIMMQKNFNKYIYKFDCSKLMKEHVIKNR